MKKILIAFFLILVCLVPAFSENAPDIDSATFQINDQQVDNPFRGALQFYLKIIIGAVGGSLMALRFTFELMHALIMNNSEGTPGEIQKVLVRFIVHVVFALLGSSAILALIRPLWS